MSKAHTITIDADRLRQIYKLLSGPLVAGNDEAAEIMAWLNDEIGRAKTRSAVPSADSTAQNYQDMLEIALVQRNAALNEIIALRAKLIDIDRRSKRPPDGAV